MTHIETGFGALIRATPLGGFAAITVIGGCWLFLLSGAGMGMSVFDMSVFGIPGLALGEGMGAPDISMHQPGPIGVVMMWWVMMLAMMLPGTLRHLPVFGDTQTSAGTTLVLFLSGYVLVWLGFALIATALQYGLVSAKILHPMKMWSSSAAFSIAILSIAGVVQFTTLKANNLLACQGGQILQSPWRWGLQYGTHCMAASLALMCLLFVGGVMNIYWIVGLTLIVTIEKLLPTPRAFSAAVGLVCFFLAATIAISTT